MTLPYHYCIPSLGAALVVDTHTAVPDVYSRLLHNPLCVLLYEDRTQPPDQWENVSSHAVCVFGVLECQVGVVHFVKALYRYV